ncbi:NADPH-dependent FMN reductase [Aerococcus kribbianus]|uniref:NAD(P)H-dependent oxidoreductase n=1 Tax=Aerococcus kribbianus TaxID=2999064 RepID=A0A9X3FP55_9LACT|nr:MULTISPECIES: NAD(P)H-dependent oxidoreductase [unclassified Aerococcus]MCZ0717148.1 NAD(P)H-dependent oxidoreductase [Aerococcus sp. YH-aer221]MCZ0725436.1 NAD(P)H-dependent oxidoreductase [Aerococcus sp. YH-aer222]
MKNIIAILGSPSIDSTNKKLLEFVEDHFQNDIDVEIVSVREWPLFNKPADFQLPEEVADLADKIDQADGVIISVAEYDHSVPAILSNALAWLSYGVYPFVEKPTLLMGTSYGRLGSSRAQFHLRQMLNAPQLAADVLSGDSYLVSYALQAFDDQGRLKDETDLADLESYMTRFLDLIARHPHDQDQVDQGKAHAAAYDQRFTRK